MAAGAEVGRITVRVLPDTDRFRRELQQQLKQIEKSTRGKVGVDTELNSGRTARQLNGTIRRLQAQARSQRVSIDVEINDRADNLRHLSQGARDLGSAFRHLAKSPIDATRALNNWRKAVKAATVAQQEAENFQNAHTINWFKNIGKSMRSGVGNIRNYRDGIRDLATYMRQADPEMSKFASRVKALGQALREGENSGAKSAVKFTDAIRNMVRGIRGTGDGKGLFSGMFGSFSDDADEAGNSASNVGKKFMGMSRMAWMGLGIFAIAAPAISLVAGLLAGLPSILAAAGAAAGVLYLGWDGIKNAASAMTPAINELKESLSGTFQERLTPVFEKLAGVLPQLKGGMTELANGMSDMFSGIVDTIASPQGVASLNTLLYGTADLFRQITPGMQKFTEGFLTLGASGAQSFGHLSGMINDFATQFNDSVNKVTSNGTFDAAMQGLAQTLGSLLSLFDRLMVAGLESMGKLGGPLDTFITGFGDLLVSLMPALTSFSALLANVFGELGTQLAPIITALTPAFTMLADTLGTLLVGALQALGPLLTMVAQFIGDFMVTALTALQPILPVIAAAFMQIATVLMEGLAPHLPALATAFGQILAAIVPLIPVILSSLMPAMVSLIQAIMKLVPVIVVLVQAFAKIMTTVGPLIAALISVVGVVAQVGAALVGVLISAIVAVIGWIVNIIAKVAEWVAGFAQGASDIAAKAAELPGMVMSALGDLGSYLLQAGKDLIQGFLNGIASMAGAVADAAKNVAAGAVNAVKGALGIHSPSRVFTEIGAFTMQGFENGMNSQKDSIVSSAKGIVDEAKKAFLQRLGLGEQFSTAIATGATGNVAADLKAQEKSMEAQQDLLDIEKLRAEIAEKKAVSKEEKEKAKAISDAIALRQDELDLQKKQLELTRKEAGAMSDLNTEYGTLLGKALGVPVDFVEAAGDQFMSDLGFSGDGFAPTLLTEGTKYVFNVSGVDEAMAIKQREQNKESLQFNRR